MKHLVVLLGLFWVVAVPARAQELAAHPEVASQIRLLDEWIQTQMDYSGLPGLVIGIVHDQDVVWSKAYGFANLEARTPMQTGSIYRIASHSKLFTSVAIMQLRDAGKLRLDDPITKYLPWFNIRDTYHEAPDITIWHLLTHSSGLPRESAHPSWTEFTFPTLQGIKDTIGQQETAYPPETKWKYSNLALTLAGLIVEAVSGRRYEEYVEREIMTPLGMSSSSVGVPDEAHRRRLATGYGRRMPEGPRDVMPFVDAKAFDPATGLSSTVENMLTFLSWQMRLRAGNGHEVLKATTLREMQRVHFLQDNWTSGNGLGFAITHTSARDLVGHGGSYPGYRTQTMLSPKEKVGVVVFTNANDGNPNRFVRKAFDWVAPAIGRALKPDAPAPTPDPGWQKYVGLYRSRGGDTKVLVLDNQLVMISPMEEDPLDGKTVLVPVGPHTFRMEGEGGGPHGELARFELDASGAVTRLFTGVNYSMRIGN
jgi:CubicO group peptidase (beta-lactamase class C family)